MIESICAELTIELKHILHISHKRRTNHGKHRFSVLATHIVKPVHHIVKIVVPLSLQLNIHVQKHGVDQGEPISLLVMLH